MHTHACALVPHATHLTPHTAHRTTRHTPNQGYDKAGEQKQGYIALGVMLGLCFFCAIVALWCSSDADQVSPVGTRSVVVTVPFAVAEAGGTIPPQTVHPPQGLRVLQETVQEEAPPPYNPAMGVDYNDTVKTSAL